MLYELRTGFSLTPGAKFWHRWHFSFVCTPTHQAPGKKEIFTQAKRCLIPEHCLLTFLGLTVLVSTGPQERGWEMASQAWRGHPSLSPHENQHWVTVSCNPSAHLHAWHMVGSQLIFVDWPTALEWVSKPTAAHCSSLERRQSNVFIKGKGSE